MVAGGSRRREYRFSGDVVALLWYLGVWLPGRVVGLSISGRARRLKMRWGGEQNAGDWVEEESQRSGAGDAYNSNSHTPTR